MEYFRYLDGRTDQAEIDPAVEKLFLSVEEEEVSRKWEVLPMGPDQISSKAQLLSDQIRGSFGLQVEFEIVQEAAFLIDLAAYGEAGQVLTIRFSLYGNLVCVRAFSDPVIWSEDGPRELLALICEHGFTPVPWIDTQFPYSGELRSPRGELLRQHGFTWEWRYFDWQ